MSASVWERVHERLDPLQLKPCVRPDVVVRELTSRDQQTYHMAKSPRAGTYVQLAERERQLLDLMDGSRTVKQIVLEDFVRNNSLAFNRVLQLVMLLHARAFLTSSGAPTYALVRQRLRAPRGFRAGIARWIDFLVRGEISLSGIDPFVTGLYRSIGWALLSGPMLALFAIVAIVGLVIFELEREDTVPLAPLVSGEGGIVVGIVVVLFLAVSILLHELGHALACKAYGCEIRRGGFRLFFGFPAFFVDTTDIWLESRRRRIVVSAAGSCVDAVVAGACALLSLVLPPDLAAISLAFAATTYLIILVNLFPLLELDGYYVLMDLLETPNLRSRSFAFLRESLGRKLGRRERFSREERILTIYGVLAFAYTTFFVLRLLRFLRLTFVDLMTGVLQDSNWVSLTITLVFAGLILAAMAVKAVRLARQAAGQAGRSARSLIRAAESVYLRPRAELLAGIPMLASLQPAQLTAIAAAMRPRRFSVGSTIIRQGDVGDRFFLIARGSAEVLRTPPSGDPSRAGSAGPSLLATLGPGDYFGELALLNQSPRAATVRALTSIDVLELSAEGFTRLVSPSWQLRERMARAAELRDILAAMPLFKDMPPSERDLLMSRVREEAFEIGQTIVQQDAAGERFYVIRDGSVRVLQANAAGGVRAVAELGAGDFFGELALLYSAPRNATVLAMTPVRVWSLSRRDFDDVLRHYLRMDGVVQATAERRLETVRRDPLATTASAAQPGAAIL